MLVEGWCSGSGAGEGSGGAGNGSVQVAGEKMAQNHLLGYDWKRSSLRRAPLDGLVHGHAHARTSTVPAMQHRSFEIGSGGDAVNELLMLVALSIAEVLIRER